MMKLLVRSYLVFNPSKYYPQFMMKCSYFPFITKSIWNTCFYYKVVLTQFHENFNLVTNICLHKHSFFLFSS